MVMNQEQERKQLLCLLRGVSLEDFQDLDCDLRKKEGKILSPFLLDVLHLFLSPAMIPLSHTDCQERAALRNGCIKKLKSINMDLQRHIQTQAVSHLQVQAQTPTEIWPQQQLEECCRVLSIQLSELQEVEDSEVLSALEASHLTDGVS